MEPNQIPTPNPSMRWARIRSFIETVKAFNEHAATEDGPRRNEVVLMTDFAQIRFNPNQEQTDDPFPLLGDVIERSVGAIELQTCDKEQIAYRQDGPYIILPNAHVQYHGSTQNMNVPGLILFVDSVKAMTMGTLSTE